jgi:two-component system KDP operon response regulator KdpE
LADDDDDMRALIRVALERDGCEVVEARDGAELIDLLGAAGRRAQPDVVVTDVQMPNFSGLGVLRALRQANSELPIILIAVDTSHAVNSDAKQWHATAVLKKPFRLEDLRAAVLDAARSQST